MVNNTIALRGQSLQVPNFLGMANTAAQTKNTLAQTEIDQSQEQRAQYSQAIKKSRDALSFINSPEQYLAWSESNYKDRVLGSMLTSMGGSPEKTRATVMAELQKPGGLERLIQQSASSADQLASTMEGRLNQMTSDRNTAAANARNAQFMSAVYGDRGGATPAPAPASANNRAPVATAMPVAPPRNTLAATPGSPEAIKNLYAPALANANVAAATPFSASQGGGAAAPANVNALTSPAPTESTAMRPPPPGAENLPMSPPVTVTAQAPAPAAPAAASPFEQFQARKEQLFSELSRIEDYLRRDPQSQIAAKRKKEVQDELKFNDSQIKSAREQIDFSQKQQELIDKKNASPKLTEDQAKTSYNLGRIVSSMDQISSATKNTPTAIAPKGLEATVKALPLWQSASGELTNLTRGPDRQIVAAAQRDMIDALLFLATGAAYNEYQLQGQIESLLPGYSDEPSAVAAKQTRLLELVDRAKARAGQGWTPEIDKQFNELVNASFSNKEKASEKAQSSIRSAADAIINGVK
jgi:hypothetical protein